MIIITIPNNVIIIIHSPYDDYDSLDFDHCN